MICIESGKQQRTVSVAQEPEVVIQREIVNFAPIFADKCRDQQQQRALRLVKVRNDAADDPVAVPRHNHDLRSCFQLIQTLLFQINGQGLQQFPRLSLGGNVVDFPLSDGPFRIGRSILAATLLLLTPDTFIDVYSWLILAAAFFASVKKMNPILVICLSGVVGYLLYGL